MLSVERKRLLGDVEAVCQRCAVAFEVVIEAEVLTGAVVAANKGEEAEEVAKDANFELN